MSEFDNNNSSIGRDGNNDKESNQQGNYSSDNYYSSYSRGENGEYSYVYTPKSDNADRKKRKGGGKYVAVSIGAAVLAFALMLVSFAIGLHSAVDMAGDDTDVNGSSVGEETQLEGGVVFEDQTQVGEQGSFDSTDPGVVLDKQDSIKTEGSDSKVTSTGNAYSSVTQVYYKVADSVVEITTEIVQNSGWMGQYVTTGAGSGVVIEKSGYIVTNNHVIEGAKNVKVRLADGSAFEATLVGTDEESDIAVIKIDPGDKKLVAAELGCSADLVVGEDVIAIGNPLGSLGGTLTTGIISATERSISVDGTEMVLLQTNAAINPGNSGGGLFNMAGQLIGVVNAKAAGEDIEGLGFAIPVDTAHEIIEDLIHYGYVRGKVDHGLQLYDADSFMAGYYFDSDSAGVFIIGSLYSDEFRKGDRIVSVDGTKVSSSDDVRSALTDCDVGDKVVFTVARGGSMKDITLTLREYVPDTVTFGD